MKTLSIDIETYSSTPLQKSGVYRYVEAPDFEILLFGYSVDAGPVQVIDLACGEHIPNEILTALEGVGAVLGLEKQKLSEGKDLIKYFCQPCAPTKVNGERTRNRPFHAPEKWADFKRYNIRDVETEMSIQQRLHKFPVPEMVWHEYHLDQHINDTGVRLDLELVKQALEMDNRSRKELTTAMQRITALENPNSVQQMKQWLAENGITTDSLDKRLLQSF